MFPGNTFIFMVLAVFWALGPGWSWIPFSVIFFFVALFTLVAGPKRIAFETPNAAQSASSAFSAALLISITNGAVLFYRERYWELALCVLVLLVSGNLWPRLLAKNYL